MRHWLSPLNVLLVIGLTSAAIFQNCAQKFESECTDCDEWRSIVALEEDEQQQARIAYYDEMQSKVLNDDPTLMLKKNKDQIQSEQAQKFGEEFAAFARLEKGFSGEVFNIYSGDINSESAQLNVSDGRIHAIHRSYADTQFAISYPMPDTDQILIGVYFGFRAQDIRMVINGKLILTSDPEYRFTQSSGVVNFSYLEKRINSTNAALELMIFGRKLSSYELACLSRHTGRLNELNFVLYDGEIEPDSDVDFIQERPEFLAARNILKANSCFKCHGGWINYGEYNFISSGLVSARRPSHSPLWTRMRGTTEIDRDGKKKNMPPNGNAVPVSELDLIKSWILSIEEIN